MSFPGLDDYQQQNLNLPGKLKALLPELGNYLEAELVRKKLDSEPTRDILPDLLAKRLNIDETFALTLLMIYDNAGVIKPKYYVLCPDTDNCLGSFKSPAELPQTIPCPHHEPAKEHDKSEYYVDLVFRFTLDTLKNYIKKS